MITIQVRGLREMGERLQGIRREQFPFAAALALTRTARLAKVEAIGQMRAKWDKPTWFVVGLPGDERRDDKTGLRVEKATPERWRAEVKLKDWTMDRQRVAADPLLRHHFFGGRRVAKGMELMLREWGLLRASEYLVLGRGEPANGFGNISHGRWTQVKSQLALKTPGFDLAATDSRRSKKHQAAAGKIWWSDGPGGNKPLVDLATGIAYGHTHGVGKKNNLPRGVWVRQGRDLHLVLAAVGRAPSYRQIFDLDRIARETVDAHFNREFRKAMRDALATRGKLGEGATRADRKADWRTRAGA